MLLPPPWLPAPCGRLLDTVTPPPPPPLASLVSLLVRLRITREFGSNTTSDTRWRWRLTSTVTDTRALPGPTRASSKRRIFCSRVLDWPSATIPGSSMRSILGPASIPRFGSITATSAGSSPDTARATRYWIASAWLALIRLLETKVTDAVCDGPDREKPDRRLAPICTRADDTPGMASTVRVSSPSFARQ